MSAPSQCQAANAQADHRAIATLRALFAANWDGAADFLESIYRVVSSVPGHADTAPIEQACQAQPFTWRDVADVMSGEDDASITAWQPAEIAARLGRQRAQDEGAARLSGVTGPVRVARLADTPLAGEWVWVRWVDAAGAHVSVEADGYRMTVLPVDWLVTDGGAR